MVEFIKTEKEDMNKYHKYTEVIGMVLNIEFEKNISEKDLEFLSNIKIYQKFRAKKISQRFQENPNAQATVQDVEFAKSIKDRKDDIYKTAYREIAARRILIKFIPSSDRDLLLRKARVRKFLKTGASKKYLKKVKQSNQFPKITEWSRHAHGGLAPVEL